MVGVTVGGAVGVLVPTAVGVLVSVAVGPGVFVALVEVTITSSGALAPSRLP
jgi:hypothetical protein